MLDRRFGASISAARRVSGEGDRYEGERRLISIGGLMVVAGVVAYLAALSVF